MEPAAFVCRFVLAAVFIRAAVPKLSRLEEFERAVRRYELLPARAARILGRCLPFVELACGVLLLVGLGIGPVASITGAFLLVFTAAVAINLARGREIDCGCFSTVAPETIGWTYSRTRRRTCT